MEYGLQVWTSSKKLERANADHNSDIKINQVAQIQDYLFY